MVSIKHFVIMKNTRFLEDDQVIQNETLKLWRKNWHISCLTVEMEVLETFSRKVTIKKFNQVINK